MSSSRSSARASRSKHGRRQSDNVAAAVTDKSHNQNHVKQKEERVLEEKIGQVVQLTGCSKDEAFVALYDCDDDPGRAIDMILERSDQGTWVESTKKKKPVKAAVTGDSGKSPERELAQDHESTATATASVGVRGRARARGGAAARFGQSSRGRQHSLGEDHGAAGWKARERRENEKNSFSGGRGGGRGSRRGGLARVFQSRQRPDVPVSSSTCDDEWSGGLDSSWTTSDDMAAWNGTAATVATADELDEWSGPLTETKVFTPSSCASVDGAGAVTTSTVTDHSTDETGVLGPSLDLASLLGKSPGAQGTCAAAAPSVVCSTAASVSYSYSDVAAVNAGVAGSVDGNVIDQHAPAHTFSEQSAVATQSSSHNVSASLKHHIETSGASLSATAFTQSSIAQKIKPHKTRMHTSTKIPESAVEMPSDAISTLSVQFGGLDFGTSALSSSVECSSASATSTSTPAFGQHSSLLSVSQQQQQSGTTASSSVRQSSHLASDRTATTAVLSSLSSSGVNASAAGFHASSSSSASPLYSTQQQQQQPMSSVSSHKTSSSAGNGPLLAGPPYQSIGSTQTAASAATTSSMYHLSTADSPAALPPSSGEQTAAGGTLSGQPAPGFGSYVNGAAAAASSGGYLSAGVSIKDKLASALSASPSSKNSQLESGMGVGLSSSGAVSSVSSSLSSSVINNGASAPAAASLHKQLAPVAAGTTSSSRAATGVPALPPGVPMQYFMGQHAGVPTAAAFYPPAGVQQIYTGYEDLHSLQQRLPPHLQQQQHSGVSEQARGDAPASLTNSNPAAAVTAAAAAAAYTSDNGSGKFSRQQENNSPISSALSQPQNPSQQQPQFFNAATLPPNYTYYPYLTPYGIYTQLPQVTNAPPHPQPAAASSQYQKLGGGGGSMPTGSSYGSGAAPAQYGAVPSAAFDPLASSSAVDYKSPFGSGAGGVSSATGGSGGAALGAAANMAAVAGSHANHKTGGGAASDVYGKMQQLSKSFDNKGFHAATPPPFGMPAAAGQAGAGGGGPYPSHHMIFQQLAPQHPSQMVGHHHHHHHHLPAAVQQHHSHHAHETGGGSTAGMQRAPSSVSHNAVAAGPSAGSVVKSSAIKPGYSTGYWSAN